MYRVARNPAAGARGPAGAALAIVRCPLLEACFRLVDWFGDRLGLFWNRFGTVWDCFGTVLEPFGALLF